MTTLNRFQVPERGSRDVQIQTLGGFRLQLRGGRLVPRFRTNSRPLLLLKILIALGGEGVSVSQLCECLWGDAEGDRGIAAFHTTLKRLRNLIGHDALPLEAGRLSLDSRFCAVDIEDLDVALKSIAQALRDRDAGATRACLEQALECYRGPFLAGEDQPSVVLAMRERLQGQLRRGVLQGGEFLAAMGQVDNAIAAYRRGLEIDPSAQDIACRLMRCCLTLGHHTEGIECYERCRNALREGAGAEPSAVTTALYRSLQATSGKIASKPAPGTGEERPRVQFVVQPFKDLSSDARPLAFSEGLAEDLITSLAHLSRESRLGRDLAVAFGTQSQPAPRGALRSGVAYVLTGSVRRVGDRLRVNARLVETRTGTPVWAERFDRPHTELLELQDDIVSGVVTEADARFVNGEQARTWYREARQHQALGLFLQGCNQWRWRMDRASHAMLGQSMRRLLGLNSNVHWAHKSLAWWHLIGSGNGWIDEEARALDLAHEHLQQALALAPDCGENLSTLAVLHMRRRQFDQGLVRAEQAVARDPASAETFGNLARCQLLSGMPERALISGRRCGELSPKLPPRISMLIGAAHLMAGRTRLALPWLDRAAREVPNFPMARAWQSAGHAAAGQRERANAAARELLRLEPGFDIGWWTRRGGMFRREGDADLMRDCLRGAGLPTLTAYPRSTGRSLRA